MPRNKDPDKPKGRTSAYAFFVQNRREDYKKQGKQVEFQLFSKECSAEWKEWKKAHEDDDCMFHKKAEEDRKRFEKEMAHYQPPMDSPGKKGKKGGGAKKRKAQDKTKPKRALSAFLYFSSDKRPGLKVKSPKASIGDLAKILGDLWRSMDEVDKQPYTDKAGKDRERYDHEMDLWKKGDFNRCDEAEVEYSDEEDED